MGLFTTNKNSTHSKEEFHYPTSKSILLIFTRNPELGKCKTRLAATIGDKNALNIYTFLLNHTEKITRDIKVNKRVYYSEEIWENDTWDSTIFQKYLQEGSDLGERMQNAFQQGFNDHFEKIVIIGSDMFDISSKTINEAFKALDKNDFVIGPAMDGGYYLLGMKIMKTQLFTNKQWGTAKVLEATLEDLKGEKFKKLALKNDIDVYDDIKDIDTFKPFLKFAKHG